MHDDTLMNVEIPSEFIDLASEWYSGQGDLLYAIASTGDLTPGSQRPYHPEHDRPMTDHEWHLHLWESLGCDIRCAVRSAERSRHEDTATLENFEAFAEQISDQLRQEYGIED